MALWRKKREGRVEGREKRGYAPEAPEERARRPPEPTGTPGPKPPPARRRNWVESGLRPAYPEAPSSLGLLSPTVPSLGGSGFLLL